MQKYLVNTAGFSKADSTLISAATLFLYMLLQPVIGALSDRIGRRPILIAFGVLGTALTVPILSTLGHIQTVWGAFWLIRSEEHTSELQSLMRNSYAVFCLKRIILKK